MAWTDAARAAALAVRRAHAKSPNWKRTVGVHLRGMTSEQARGLIAEIGKTKKTIVHPQIQHLTGGFNSQAINNYVMRKLGIKAGYIKSKK